MMKIPLAKPSITDLERRMVDEVLHSSQLSQGPWVSEFERVFAGVAGSKHAVAVSSGTAALHLAIKSLGIGSGDEVITTPFSFIASANCISYEGASPVFVDVEEDTFGMNPQLIEEKITSRTKAILAVHVFGQPCNISTIKEICERRGLFLIEDCCESLMSRHKGKLVGSFGDIATYGFYPNKQITTGEGGMITCRSKNIADKIISLRNQGRSINSQVLVHDEVGFNYRLSDINAALGIAQIGRLESILSSRREVYIKYCNELSDLSFVRLVKDVEYNRSQWFIFPVRVKERRNRIIAGLKALGVESKAYFSPSIHLQPIYRSKFNFKAGTFPISEKLSEEILVLPFFTSMSSDEILYVTQSLRKAVEESQKEYFPNGKIGLSSASN